MQTKASLGPDRRRWRLKTKTSDALILKCRKSDVSKITLKLSHIVNEHELSVSDCKVVVLVVYSYNVATFVKNPPNGCKKGE